jgi:hypothetical protein
MACIQSNTTTKHTEVTMSNNKTNQNEPAFSCTDGNKFYDPGLTKREYFAGLAMQGLLTRLPKRENNERDLGILESKRIADEAVIMANELIKALNNE